MHIDRMFNLLSCGVECRFSHKDNLNSVYGLSGDLVKPLAQFSRSGEQLCKYKIEAYGSSESWIPREEEE